MKKSDSNLSLFSLPGEKRRFQILDFARNGT